MSLVERALQKMQQAGLAARPADKTPSSPPEIPAVPVEAPARVFKPVQRSTAVAKFDREELRRLNLLPPVAAERRLAHQFQTIKRPLVVGAMGHAADATITNTALMVASALPGEGKTFTCLNLALSLALEKDIEVLLVDADVRKPHVSRLLGVGSEPGLLELLMDGDLHPDSMILDSNIPGLSVLPAGRPLEIATELLSSKRMKEIVGMLAPRGGRRIVVFDSPPLLLSTESHALATHMGQIVMVVRAEVTPQKAVLQAVDSLGDRSHISLVLNQSSAESDVNYYGYGGYGDAAPSGSTKAANKN